VHTEFVAMHLSPPGAALPDGLAALVIKRGVSLGLLAEGERDLALALTAAALPHGATYSEAEVNQALRRCLQAEAAFLATDHVELRRWLVDSGFWRRDGFGRRYESLPAHALPAHRAALVQALGGLDLSAWVAEQQAASHARRDARRVAWRSRQGGPGG